MKILTKVHIADNASGAKSSSSWEDMLPGAGGLVGSLLQPEGLLPGAATSGLFGAVGETARQGVRAATGKGFDAGQILKTGGEQAAYGAIPGGQEIKALPAVGKLAENVIGRGALRFGTGALAGGTAQAVSNIGSKDSQSPLGTGTMAGAINAISPLLGETINLVPKGVKLLGRTAVKSSENILEKKSQPELNAVQRLFGKESISTGEGKAAIDSTVKSVIDKYQIPLPPTGDIKAFKPALDKASKDVESKLQPILKDPIYAVKTSEVQDIINGNLKTYFGGNKKLLADLPVDVKNLYTKPSIGKDKNVSLSDLKQAQREVGKVVKSWTEPKDKEDLFAISMYHDLGNLIDNKLSTVDKTEYKSLINEHKILVKARDSYQKTVGGSGTLPADITSRNIAEEKAMSGLSGERLRELGVRSLPLVAGGAAQLTGLPPGVKEMALLLSGLYGAAQFGPHLNPDSALKMGSALENTPEVGNKFQRSLQQLGVRVPGLK